VTFSAGNTAPRHLGADIKIGTPAEFGKDAAESCGDPAEGRNIKVE
jgi:hypothetical protein